MRRRAASVVSRAARALRRAAPALLILAAACAPTGPERLTLDRVGFDRLPGWMSDRQGEALVALRRSCGRLASLPGDRALGPDGVGGTVADWRAPCAAQAALDAADHAAARAFFEDGFAAWAAGDRGVRDGLFTGYFEISLNGSRTRSARYRVPLYLRPPELVEVDLGRFDPELKGKRIAGRVEAGRLVPYPDRAAIDEGALHGRGLELVWVDDPVDAFFLHIQGSGRVTLDDGAVLRVGYAAANGRSYRAIGRDLVEIGALERDAVSMQSIRAWLEANPDRAAAMMAKNPSYVFFRRLTGDGPIGAQGVALTAGRSLAVDRRFLPLGVPVWLDTTDPLFPDRPIRRLMVAQDTGGAIRGPVRGDVFWGHGAEAAERAGLMKQRGRYYLLLPKSVRPGSQVAARGGAG